jgi:Dermatopontin
MPHRSLTFLPFFFASGYIFYDQFSDMSTTLSCATEEISKEVWWCTSSASLMSQVSKSSYGLDAIFDLGVFAVLPEGLGAYAGTTVRAALVFGNTKSSTTAFSEQNSGRTHSFDAHAQRSLYNVELDYDSIGTWTPAFMKACRALSLSSRSTLDILEFFHQFGTHGLDKATFGQECTSTVYMEAGETLSTYYKFRSEQKTIDASLLWWTTSNSKTKSNELFTSELYGFEYSIANRRCHGELDTDSTCGALMQGTGKDSPAIIAWTYTPIWEMNVPFLSDEAKQDLRKVFIAIVDASVDCMESACSGNGACAPNIDAWNAIERASLNAEGYNLAKLFDGKRCFCLEDFQGPKCDIGRPIKVSLPAVQAKWANNWDGQVDFSNGAPLCGMQSEYNSWHKDRRFKFRTCQIDEKGTDFVLKAGSQETFESWWNEPFLFLCDQDKVMTRLMSDSPTSFYQDRRWQATCTHFKNTRTNSETCEGFDIGAPGRGEFDNTLKEFFDFKCPVGKVLTGIYADHDTLAHDRKFKFRCCEMMVEYDTTMALKESPDWTPYVNGYEKSMNVVPSLDGEDAAFCGVKSDESSFYRDRRFQFKYCKPLVGSKRVATTKSASSGYKEKSRIDCPVDSVLGQIKSTFKGLFVKDRLWSYMCHRFDGWTTDYCQWTDWVSDLDQPFDFECGDQHVIAGMESEYNLVHQDRQFKLKCCRWKASAV